MRRPKRILLIGAEVHPGHGVIKGIHTYCLVHGAWDFHREIHNHPQVTKRLRQAIHVWKADGIIAHVVSRTLEMQLRNCGLPVINVSGFFEDLALPSVIVDNAAVARMAARYLLDNGFRSFAYCARTCEAYTQSRCDIFVRELAEAGFGCEVFTDECAIGKPAFALEPDWIKNRQRMQRWLLSLKKPVAIQCIYDLRSQEVAEACRRLGLRVPDDVSILGIGNDESHCLTCTPPLSSIDVNLEGVGYEAAHVLDHLMHGGKAPSKAVLIPPRHVVPRRSSDIVAIDDPDTAAAIRFIRDHAHEPISIKNLLSDIPLSRRTMERRFEKLIGHSPAAELLRVRMDRAKNLLNKTELPIPAVAKGAGFTDAKAFAVSFRRNVGATPTDYRRNRLKSGTFPA